MVYSDTNVTRAIERIGGSLKAKSDAFERRNSYGPTSPTIGERGAQTRQQIVESALGCFAKIGFHTTSVDDIATAADVSRATLYQYFESKQAIFIELMDEAGDALMRVTRRLGAIGPTPEGFDNLHWWLGEWNWVFERYATLFVEWANVASPKAPLRPRVTSYVDRHAEQFGESLAAAGYPVRDQHTAAIVVLGLLNRYHYINHVYRPGLTNTQLVDNIATALQLFLFPDTPHEFLRAGPQSALGRQHRVAPSPSPDAMGPLAHLAARTDIEPLTGRFDLSDQAHQTMRNLLDAGSAVFADSGFDGASIDAIVKKAGVARGTYYRYFTDKLDLLRYLAHDCALAMTPPFQQLGVAASTNDPAALRAWLNGFIVLQERYAGVLRSWTEGYPNDPQTLSACRDTVIGIGAAVRSLFGQSRAYALDRRAAGLMLSALLEHVPNEGRGSKYEPTVPAIIEMQATFIERVIVAT